MHHDPDIERFYTSRSWRACRSSVLKERGGLCELCLAKGLIEPAVHVHHKTLLTPENVREAASLTRPAAVDVSSGVETQHRKDPLKIRQFVREVRGMT